MNSGNHTVLAIDFRRYSRPAALLAMMLAAFSGNANAQTIQRWTGSAGADWNSTSWTTNTSNPGTQTTPVSGDTLDFRNTLTGGNPTNRTNNNNFGGLSVAGITMNNGSPSYTLGGNQLTVTGNINGGGAGNNTINLDLVLNAAVAQFTGAASGGMFTINGTISETGGSRSFTHQGGSITLNGANSFSGAVIVGNAPGTNSIFINTLATASTAQSLGTGTVVNIGNTSAASLAEIIYTGAGPATTDKQWRVGSSTATATLSGAIRNNGGGAITWNGTQALGNANAANTKTFILGGTNNDDNTWNSAIQNGGANTQYAVTKENAGKWILAGNNSYTGATTVSAGTLLVNGNQSGAVGAVSVAANAILGGTGTLGGASAAITGTVAPGLSGSLGTLTFAGSAMDFSTGGSLLAQLNSNPAVFTSDLLAISGAGSLTLGGSSILDLVGPTTFTTSGTYTLATFASGSSVNQFTTVRYNGTAYANPTTTNAVNSNGTLVYNANSIQLVVVPEPGTLALAGLGVGLAGFTAWKRRRRA